MKLKFATTVVVLVAVIAGGPVAMAAETQLVERIVAVVNDSVILLSELEAEWAPYAKRIRSSGYPAEKEKELLFKVRSDVLDRLIEDRMTDLQIKQRGISVSEADVDRAIEGIKKNNSVTDEELRIGLTKQGMTWQAYRTRVRKQLLRNRLITTDVRSRIVITAEDVQAYYDAHTEEFSTEGQVHLRHITALVDKFADATERTRRHELMNRLLTQLDQGADFETVAAQAREAGGLLAGDLGTFKTGVLAEELRAAIHTLEAGQHTRILETDRGFQLFQVTQIQTAPARPLEEVASIIQDKLFAQRANEKYDAWMVNLKERSHIKVIH